MSALFALSTQTSSPGASASFTSIIGSIWEKSPSQVEKVLGKPTLTERSSQNGYPVRFHSYKPKGKIAQSLKNVESIDVIFWWKQPAPKFINFNLATSVEPTTIWQSFGLNPKNLSGYRVDPDGDSKWDEISRAEFERRVKEDGFPPYAEIKVTGLTLRNLESAKFSITLQQGTIAPASVLEFVHKRPR